MTVHAFCRYDLRTTDPDAAKRFYAALGIAVDAPSVRDQRRDAREPDEPETMAVWLLHEQARARGAPSHWLGSIAVADVETTARRLSELGSEPFGSVVRGADGTPFAMLRDPIGAVVAIRESVRLPRRSHVAWHHLHTRDVERAWGIYSDVFAWSPTGTADAPDLDGGYRMFAWDAAGASVGSMANTARWPGVHVHWLFYFAVADLDAALVTVRAHGGSTLTAAILPNGDRIAPCQDPQGAAFGLLQRASPATP